MLKKFRTQLLRLVLGLLIIVQTLGHGYLRYKILMLHVYECMNHCNMLCVHACTLSLCNLCNQRRANTV